MRARVGYKEFDEREIPREWKINGKVSEVKACKTVVVRREMGEYGKTGSKIGQGEVSPSAESAKVRTYGSGRRVNNT